MAISMDAGRKNRRATFIRLFADSRPSLTRRSVYMESSKMDTDEKKTEPRSIMILVVMNYVSVSRLAPQMAAIRDFFNAPKIVVTNTAMIISSVEANILFFFIQESLNSILADCQCFSHANKAV